MANPSSPITTPRVADSAGIAMFKNKLQEYAQKRRLPMPAYRSVNEGFPHAPKFRVRVLVDGAEYTSKSTFRRLREAEQDAAKLAYDCIISNAKQSDFKPNMPVEEQRCSKSILHEMTFKKHRDFPKYRTVLGEAEGNLPTYVSKVTVMDKTFTGAEARTKRDAEQSAARAALQSLQGTDSRAVLNQMTTPKRKLYDAPFKVNNPEFNQKKIRNMGAADGPPGAVSQVKNIVKPFTSAPRPSTPVSRPIFRRRPQPGSQGVRFGMGNGVQGANLVNRKVQQHGRFA